LSQHAHMPDYLRFPFKCVVLLFDACGFLHTGRPFHRLSHERRWRVIRTWQRSRLGFRRDFIRFFLTLTVFAWYSELYGQDY
jgi:hypothetical protein